jgi:mannose-6-phosphate isomerase-like protein (cupin superfamily)
MAGKDYDIHMDVKYRHLEAIDVRAEAAAHAPWFNQTLTQVNDAVVRVGVFEGEFHFHKHDREDEFFFVLEGELFMDFEGEPTVRLAPQQGLTVPKGVVHRPRAPKRTVVLMVESATIAPTGDQETPPRA